MTKENETKTLKPTRLTEKEMIEKAPPIAAKEPMGKVSTSYNFIDSMQIVKHFDSSGWFVRDAQATVPPKRSQHHGYQTHLVRFAPENESLCFLNDDSEVESFPEIIMTNSHNRLRSLQFEMGIFRMVCANGMVIGERLMPRLRVKHHIQYAEMVKTVIGQALESMEKLSQRVNDFKSIELSEKQQRSFANRVIKMQFDGKAYKVSPSDLLTRVREADQPNSLWHTFNVIQEKVINGGVEVKPVNKEQKLRLTKTKPIKSPVAALETNRTLWDIAEKVR